MKPTFNEKLIVYLTLLSGLCLSAVAVYYSVAGLTAIFAAAVIPIMIMGIALEVSKIVATVWLKQNWKVAPWTVKTYLCSAIAMLMVITSMGIFGFLSKAHSDQTLVSGDVQSKIAIYDEKIKTAKENIDANRKGLKQLDDAVDQVMGRSTDEKGADKAVAIRRSQSKERARLIADIEAEQKTISRLNEEAAPIRAEVRKVEAEVGPIKYIAAFVYGDTDTTVLEKAVTWVIILIIVVFDPLALILLIASQISFQNFREREQEKFSEWTDDDFEEIAKDAWVADVGEKPTAEELAEGDSPNKDPDNIVEGQPTVTEPAPHHPDTHPYLRQGFRYPEGWKHIDPVVYRPEEPEKEEYVKWPGGVGLEETTSTVAENLFVQNEEQQESGLWSAATGIGPKEYFTTSQKKLEKPQNFEEYMEMIEAKSKRDPVVSKYASLIKSGQTVIEKVPEEYVEEVLAKLKAT